MTTKIGNGKDGRLTERMRRFVESFVAHGNASEAARRSGCTWRPNATGSRMLRRPAVAAAIQEQSARLAAATVATAKEVREFLTAAMRGELKDLTPEHAFRRDARADSGAIRRQARNQVACDQRNARLARALLKSPERSEIETTHEVTTPTVIDAEVADAEPAAEAESSEPPNEPTDFAEAEPATPATLEVVTSGDAERRARQAGEIYRRLGV